MPQIHVVSELVKRRPRSRERPSHEFVPQPERQQHVAARQICETARTGRNMKLRIILRARLVLVGG